jgi:hypothetical protein
VPTSGIVRSLWRTTAPRFEGLLPGTYQVEVSCADRRAEPSYPPVVVAGADVHDLLWRVSAGLTLRGKLVDRDDKPVVGRVRASATRTDALIDVMTDVRPDGRSRSRPSRRARFG